MDLDKCRVVAIMGDIDTGKTNAAVSILRNYSGTRKIYTYGYPIPIDNFANISHFNDLFQLSDAIILIDEIQRYVKTYDGRKNTQLQELVSFFAHNNNTLIMTSPLSQFITKGTEGQVDTWILTRIRDLQSLKNGSAPKRLIQSTGHPRNNPWSLALKNGEYLENSASNSPEENGVKTFQDQYIKKDWRVNKNSDKKCDKSCDNVATNFATIQNSRENATSLVHELAQTEIKLEQYDI